MPTPRSSPIAAAPAALAGAPAAWPRRPRLVSVVCPVYNEEAMVDPFAGRLLAVLDGLGVPFEAIFVEDDSSDGTLARLRALHARRPDAVRVLALSRRFGHQASLAAGFQHARGDVVVCLDSDLQHPPELIPELVLRWARGDQIVTTRRRRSAGRGPLKEAASRAFYRLMDAVSDVSLDEGSADFRLMDRAVTDALNRFGERALLYRGLVSWVGFRRSVVEYEAAERAAGRSHYTWRRMLRLGLDGLFAFSLLPLRLTFALGGIGVVLSMGYGAYSLAAYLAGRTQVPGYTSLVLLIAFLGSLNLMCLGIVGEYVGRVHEQVKGRPLYLVREALGPGRDGDPAP